MIMRKNRRSGTLISGELKILNDETIFSANYNINHSGGGVRLIRLTRSLIKIGKWSKLQPSMNPTLPIVEGRRSLHSKL